MKDELQLRWLGAAGFELKASGGTLAVDPYFTRISFWRQWFRRLQPNVALAQRMLPVCDHILVTHAHWDHLMDAPAVAVHTGAKVYGSANTCWLLSVLGVPEGQIRQVQSGERLKLGGFAVKVQPAEHMRVPVFTPGPLDDGLRPPLQARQYRMDECFAFHITAGGVTLLTDPGKLPGDAEPADVLLVNPLCKREALQALLERVRPRLVMPSHWDDMWQPLDQPVRPSLRPPARKFPFFGRVNLEEFKCNVKRADPAIRVLIPERLQTYNLPAFNRK